MEDVRERLSQSPDVRITVLPDGSVDRRAAVVDADGEPMTRSQMGQTIASDGKTFLTESHGIEPGGQSVNAARQLAELDVSTALVGHLDHPIFETLPFQTYSMGEPAEIHVYELADGVTMFASESGDIETWTHDRFEEAVGPAAADLLDVDLVLWMNWAAFPHGTAALRHVLEETSSPLVIDPGAVSTRPQTDRREFLDSLGASDDVGDVILSPSAREAVHLADAIDCSSTDRSTIANELLECTRVEAVVVHDKTEATVATGAKTVDVPTIEDVEPQRYAGAGDRFSAAVAYGRALDWSWEEILTLGNLCATHYLVHGRSGDREDLSAMMANL